MSSYQSFIINSVSLALLVTLIPACGLISDYFGRAKTILIGCILIALLGFPYFYIASTGSFYQILLAHMLTAIPCAIIFAVTPVLITEIFPLSVRCSITNLVYSLAACIGGGITPLITFQITSYGNSLPGLIPVVLGSINIVFIGIYLKQKSKKTKICAITAHDTSIEVQAAT